jgi:hypothetical protein
MRRRGIGAVRCGGAAAVVASWQRVVIASEAVRGAAPSNSLSEMRTVPKTKGSYRVLVDDMLDILSAGILKN